MKVCKLRGILLSVRGTLYSRESHMYLNSPSPFTKGFIDHICCEMIICLNTSIVILSAHILHWKAEGRSAIWLHIPLQLSALIPLVADLGFTLHHAQGEEVVMNRWLLENKHNKLPHYASHQVGACGKRERENGGAACR